MSLGKENVAPTYLSFTISWDDEKLNPNDSLRLAHLRHHVIR